MEKILQAAELTPQSLVVEIGPGEGVLTLSLCQRARRVHAFEVDPDLATRLSERDIPNLVVHQGDFLKQDPAERLASDAAEPIVVVANLPYYITAPILQRLFWDRPLRVERAVLMMQHEVAARVTRPSSREAGALTYIVGAYYAAEYLFKVPPGCFKPPPKVDSAVIRLTPDDQLSRSDPKMYERLVGTAFRARRKQLGRSFRALHSEAPEILSAAGIDSKRRPETLTVQEFWDLARKWPRCE